MHPERFRFSIDRGGTFTDVYAEVPGETGFRVVKLLSEDPDNYEDAPREGIRRILEDVTGQSFDPKVFDSDLIEWIRMGTTVATNALLERKGAKAGIITTAGFRDVLEMRRRDRPTTWGLWGQYTPVIERQSRLEVAERTLASGEVTTPVDPDEIRAAAAALLEQGCEAVCLFLSLIHI